MSLGNESAMDVIDSLDDGMLRVGGIVRNNESTIVKTPI